MQGNRGATITGGTGHAATNGCTSVIGSKLIVDIADGEITEIIQVGASMGGPGSFTDGSTSKPQLRMPWVCGLRASASLVGFHVY